MTIAPFFSVFAQDWLAWLATRLWVLWLTLGLLARSACTPQPTAHNEQLTTDDGQQTLSELQCENLRHSLQQFPVLFAEGCRLVTVNVDLTQHAPRAHNGHDNL